MTLTVNFKHFDPLADKLPESYDWMFADLAARARRLIAGRSHEEIEAVARILNEIHRAPGYRDPLWEEIKQDPVPSVMHGQPVQLVPASNEVEALYKNVGNVSLAPYTDFPNGQWHEVFAVLALSYTGQVCGAVHAKENWQETIKDKWLGHVHPNPFYRPTDAEIEAKANDCLALAQQAIGLAEAIKNQSGLVRDLWSKESSQAARKRHESSSGPLKAAVITLHREKHQARSNRDAARRIFEELQQDQRLQYDAESGKVLFDGKFSLQNDDPERRFEIWIGKAKKGK